MAIEESKYLRLVTIIGIAIPVTVALIFWLPRGEETIASPQWLFGLPRLHAILNGTSFCVLLLGYYFIMNKQILRHKTCMLVSAALSAVFLVSYVIYHSVAPEAKFGGEGTIRYFYFTLLISHIMLAAIIVPFILITLYNGLLMKVEKHRKIARWTLPMWLYVAFTGVIVYLMMSPYYPS